MQKQCAYPRSHDAMVLNLHARRIAATLGRAQDLKRASCFGYRQQNAWANIRHVESSLSADQWQPLKAVLAMPLTQERVLAVETTLVSLLKQQQAQDVKARVSAWKRKIMNSEKHAYKWAKGSKSADDHTMLLPDGAVTANEEQQLKEILAAWVPIFTKFAKQKADPGVFMNHFSEYMKSSPMQSNSTSPQ